MFSEDGSQNTGDAGRFQGWQVVGFGAEEVEGDGGGDSEVVIEVAFSPTIRL